MGQSDRKAVRWNTGSKDLTLINPQCQPDMGCCEANCRTLQSLPPNMNCCCCISLYSSHTQRQIPNRGHQSMKIKRAARRGKTKQDTVYKTPSQPGCLSLLMKSFERGSCESDCCSMLFLLHHCYVFLSLFMSIYVEGFADMHFCACLCDCVLIFLIQMCHHC